MSQTKIWEKTYWSSPLPYISHVFIREYDIKKANANILYSKGLIDKETYRFICNLKKSARERYVGKLTKERKEEKLGLEIIKGIREYRRLFFEANNIQEYEVLSIKNDAIFLVGKIPSVTTFGSIEFVNKETYTSYYRLDRKFNIECFYNLDIVNDREVLEIKGINNRAYAIHEPYMIDFLKVLFSTIETCELKEAIGLIKAFSDSYLRKELPLDYYRRFSSKYGYDTIIRDSLGNMYNITNLNESDRSIIEIGYNYGIIMNLYRIVSSMYFNKK